MEQVRRGWILTVAVVALMALAGCLGEEVPPEEPTAGLVLLHEAVDLGNVEVLIDGKVLRVVAPAELTGQLAVPIGAATLEMRNPGAASSLLSQSFDFKEQVVLVALTGSSAGGTLGFFTVDAVPPEVLAEEHALEVVNLRTDGRKFNVFVGTVRVAQEPGDRTVGPFTTVAPGSVTLGISDPNGAPLATAPATLTAGKATMLLIGGTGDTFTFNPIPLR